MKMLHMQHVHAYKVQILQALMPEDKPKCAEFATLMLERIDADSREFSHPSCSLNGLRSSDVIDARANRSHSSYVNHISGAVITRRLTRSLFSLTAVLKYVLSFKIYNFRRYLPP